MSLGTIIRQRREQMGMTQDQVAAAIRISKPYLSNIETGRTRNPPADSILEMLERTLQFQTGQLKRVAHLQRTPPEIRQERDLLLTQVQNMRKIVQQLLTEKPSEQQRQEYLRQIQADRPVGELSAGIFVPIINKASEGYPSHMENLSNAISSAKEYLRCPDIHDTKAFAIRVCDDSMSPTYNKGDLVVLCPAVSTESGQDCFVHLVEGKTTFRRVYLEEARSTRLQPLNVDYRPLAVTQKRIVGMWTATLHIRRIAESTRREIATRGESD